MLLALLSLLMVDPAPLDMPRAEAYLVRDDGELRLEDRYDKLEQWISQAVIGRWTDDDGREFLLSKLDFEPPAVDLEVTVTREDYARERVAMKRIRANHDLPEAFTAAIDILSPCAVAEKPRPPKQMPRGYADVDYWQHPTNLACIVCAFRPEKCETWYLASWQLAPGDDYCERMQIFEDNFLREEFEQFLPKEMRPKQKTEKTVIGERELLRADARHAVAAYPNWHCWDSKEFEVLEDIGNREFVNALTNEFATMRAKYAVAVPTGIDGSNALCVARLYVSRDEYLDALETSGVTNMDWSAAYWTQSRRELVAYLPQQGEEELMKTFRHEAFHQYLSYAASMLAVSPWLNEGYAQYFEDEKSRDWELSMDMTPGNVEKLAQSLPGVLGMSYGEFYGGSDAERRLKYRLAWSIAVFLENGAEKVRFQPFKNLKADYFKELFKSHDMRLATSAAFRNQDNLKRFVSEWKDFWLGK